MSSGERPKAKHLWALFVVAAVGEARTYGATLYMVARERIGLPSTMEAESIAAAKAQTEAVDFILAGL